MGICVSSGYALARHAIVRHAFARYASTVRISGGSPLAEDVRLPMEAALGADLSAVCIHEGTTNASPSLTAGIERNASATLASSSQSAIAFAEADIEAIVPLQPDEPSEAREERIAQSRNDYEQARADAVASLGGFRAQQGERIAELSAMAPHVHFDLETAEQRAAEQVNQAAFTQSRAVRSAVSRSISKARTAAAAARSQIQASHAATVAAINTATKAARPQITASYQQAIATTYTAEEAQIAQVGQLYTQAESAFHTSRINRDDSFLDGPLTGNQQGPMNIIVYAQGGSIVDMDAIIAEARHLDTLAATQIYASYAHVGSSRACRRGP